MLFYQRVWTMTSKNCIWTEDYWHWMKSFDQFFSGVEIQQWLHQHRTEGNGNGQRFHGGTPKSSPIYPFLCFFSANKPFIGHFPWCSMFFFRIFHENQPSSGVLYPMIFSDTGPRSTPDNIFGDTLKPGSPTPELADGFVVFFLTPWFFSLLWVIIVIYKPTCF